MESSLVYLASAVSNLTISSLPFGFRHAQGVTTSLPADVESFVVRSDFGEPSTTVNVHHNGTKVYTFERLNNFSKQWVMRSVQGEESIAIIKVGLFNRSVDFLSDPNIQHRDLKGFLVREFTLNDGASYSWTRHSGHLERIVNKGAGVEERRERLGKARLLRRFRFEWEVLVDKSFDIRIALATGFIAMLTQWPLYRNAAPGIRFQKSIPHAETNESRNFASSDSSGEGGTVDEADAVAGAISKIPPHLTVYTPDGKDPNFFVSAI